MTSNLLKTVIAFIIIIFAVFCTISIASIEKNPFAADGEIFIINGGTYDVDVIVIITPDIEKAMEFVMENITTPVTPEDFQASGTTFMDEEGRIVMWLSSSEDEGVITHELFHTTSFIMSWFDIPFDESTEHAYAYELQYLTNQFYKQIK
jgi:hypothetical protein